MIWSGLQIQRIPSKILYDYQIAKAQKSQAETIFVGDSALGNAINADLYTKLSGKKTENYALTGSFGYRGSLNMIKKVHASNKNVKRVIVMQTLDMMNRPIAPEFKPSISLFKSDGFNGLDLGIFNFISLKFLIKALKNPSWNIGGIDQIKNDYIPQKLDVNTDYDYPSLTITKGKSKYLAKIADYCNQNGLSCIYAHAPIMEEVCINSKKYIQAVNKIISRKLSLGLKAPPCIPKDQLGDSTDHVHPDYKDEFTRYYYSVLQ